MAIPWECMKENYETLYTTEYLLKDERERWKEGIRNAMDRRNLQNEMWEEKKVKCKLWRSKYQYKK